MKEKEKGKGRALSINGQGLLLAQGKGWAASQPLALGVNLPLKEKEAALMKGILSINRKERAGPFPIRNHRTILFDDGLKAHHQRLHIGSDDGLKAHHH